MHTSVYDASPPRGSDSSSVQTHHGAASATQSPAGAAAHMEKGGASERTPAARELSPASTVSAADFSAALQVTVCPRSCDGVSCACPRTMNGFHRTLCHSTRVLAFARVALDNIKTRLAHMDE
jgi:hypothetical protein